METTTTVPELTGFRFELPATINFTIWAKDRETAARLVPAALACYDGIDVDNHVLGFSWSEARLYADPPGPVSDYDVADEFAPDDDDTRVQDDTVFWSTRYVEYDVHHPYTSKDITDKIENGPVEDKKALDELIDAKGVASIAHMRIRRVITEKPDDAKLVDRREQPVTGAHDGDVSKVAGDE